MCTCSLSLSLSLALSLSLSWINRASMPPFARSSAAANAKPRITALSLANGRQQVGGGRGGGRIVAVDVRVGSECDWCMYTHSSLNKHQKHPTPLFTQCRHTDGEGGREASQSHLVVVTKAPVANLARHYTHITGSPCGSLSLNDVSR